MDSFFYINNCALINDIKAREAYGSAARSAVSNEKAKPAAVRVSERTRQEVYIFYILTTQEGKKRERLQPLDFPVLDAVFNLRRRTAGQDFKINESELLREMTGGRKLPVTDERREKLRKSIERLSSCHITLKCDKQRAEWAKAKNRLTVSQIERFPREIAEKPLLPLRPADDPKRAGKEREFIFDSENADFFDYCLLVGQFQLIPLKQFALPTRADFFSGESVGEKPIRTTDRRIITNYLAAHILSYKINAAEKSAEKFTKKQRREQEFSFFLEYYGDGGIIEQVCKSESGTRNYRRVLNDEIAVMVRAKLRQFGFCPRGGFTDEQADGCRGFFEEQKDASCRPCRAAVTMKFP